MLFFLGLAVLATWPLVLNFNSSVLGDPTNPDHYQFVWNTWWIKWSLLDLHTNPFQTEWLFHPYGVSLALHTLGLLQGVYALPVTTLFGPVAGYNLVVITWMALNGYAAYRLFAELLELRRDWLPLVGGAALVLAPFHLRHAATDLTLSLWPLLLFLVTLVRLRRRYAAGESPPLWRVIIWPAVWLALSFFSSLYIFSYAAFVAALFVAATLFEKKWPPNWAGFGRLALAVGLAFGLVGLVLSPLLWGIVQDQRSGLFRTAGFDGYVFIHSLVPYQLLATQPNTLLGRLTGATPQNFGYPANYLGWLVLPVALVGVAVAFRQRRLRWWAIIGLLFGTLAIGPQLRLDDAAAKVSTSQPWLPYTWLQKIPILNLGRNPVDYFWITLVCLLLFWVVGLSFIRQRFTSTGNKRGRNLLLAGLAFGLVLADFAGVSPGLHPMTMPEIYAHLDGRPAGAAVLELPFNSNDEKAMFYQTVHHRPIFDAYISRPLLNDPYLVASSPFRAFWPVGPLPNGAAFPDFDPNPAATTRRTLTLLNYYNVGYIALHKDSTLLKDAAASRQFLGQLLGNLPPLWEDDKLTMFELPAETASTPFYVVGDGWFNAEKEGQAAARWMQQTGILYLFSREGHQATLSFDATAFAGPFEIEPALNGQALAKFTVGEKQTFRLTLNLKPGQNELNLRAIQPARRPADFGSGSDTRELTIKVQNVTLAAE